MIKWRAGDYAMIGAKLVIVAEQLCERLDLRAGQRVLDVACGHGKAALAAARRGCVVSGVDLVDAWLRQARERASAEQLEVGFCHGDALALPFPDASFDVVLSVFGAPFAGDHPRAAAELLRVCRPGGKIALANWTPSGFGLAFFQTLATCAPQPSQGPSPLSWGEQATLVTLFREAGGLRIEPRRFTHRYPSAEAFVGYFRRHFGPAVCAFQRLDDDGRERLAGELLAVAQRFDRSDDASWLGDMDYLEVDILR